LGLASMLEKSVGAAGV
jgi:hypothetical protein